MIMCVSSASTSNAMYQYMCLVQKYYGGLTRQAKVAVPFRVRPSLRWRHHLINDSSKPSPGKGQAAERRLPQCPSAKRRVPQRIISPPCQSSRCRRYPYACHAPKGLGRGAPEGKGYAGDNRRLRFRWSFLNECPW